MGREGLVVPEWKMENDEYSDAEIEGGDSQAKHVYTSWCKQGELLLTVGELDQETETQSLLSVLEQSRMLPLDYTGPTWS